MSKPDKTTRKEHAPGDGNTTPGQTYQGGGGSAREGEKTKTTPVRPDVDDAAKDG